MVEIGNSNLPVLAQNESIAGNGPILMSSDLIRLKADLVPAFGECVRSQHLSLQPIQKSGAADFLDSDYTNAIASTKSFRPQSILNRTGVGVGKAACLVNSL
jgi:hypothetical protein